MIKRVLNIKTLLSLIAYSWCLSSNITHTLSSWKSPSNNLRYNEVCFLTAHNAYAAKRHGYYYAQQRLTIQEQLEAGVRGLMLDTHINTGYRVLLCHRTEFLTKLICGGKDPMPLYDALETIKEFLEKHPTEIITIFLENYVSNKDIIDTPFMVAALEPFILKPSDWDPAKQQGWPTLKWMQEKNKRLVIFNGISDSKLTYHQWPHTVENQWGALSHKHAAKERVESRACRSHERYLYVVNYFPKLKVNWGNTYQEINATQLEGFLNKLRKGVGGGLYKERAPNFICLDFIDEGDGMKYVNEINARTENERSWLFRSLKQELR